MKRLALFVATFTVLTYFGTPAWAQGKGGAGAGGFGRGFGGAPTIRGGEGKGYSGREMRSRIEGSSKGEALKGTSSSMGGEKTTSELLTQNTKLSSKLEPLLPAGTNVQDAAQGYDNLGQFVAAVHVSKNLDIPFSDLKGEMLGGKSLGQAIHELKPSANAHEEAIKANKQALKDMEESFGGHKSDAVDRSSSKVKAGK
jgi:hypothetical protein